MNDDLKKKLEAQRKWRTSSVPAQPTQGHKGLSFAQKVVVFTVGAPMAAFVIYLAFAAWVIAPRPLEVTTTPVPAKSATASTKSQESKTMTACTGSDTNGKLHVRFEPGLQGEVRGYLTEGETVILPLGEQNEPIIQIVDDMSWIYIQSPITGWVSASHLCK